MIQKEALLALGALAVVSVAFGYVFNKITDGWRRDWKEHKDEKNVHENGWDDDDGLFY